MFKCKAYKEGGSQYSDCINEPMDCDISFKKKQMPYTSQKQKWKMIGFYLLIL